MKLPENMSNIVGKTYKGQKDEEGRPHGHGIMEYYTKTEKKYKYGRSISPRLSKGAWKRTPPAT